ncbi:MAG: 6-phosphogluconolactonase [Anaerolineales bacterium]|nr:6-phosphogluconolactonase [Anaerolineales bacterium]MCB9126813.1 6-phosphogluconolactonase [Ardenticatenales bacterium]
MAVSLHCYATARWAEKSAALIAEQLIEAVERNGTATLMLAGGNTPRPLYEALAKLTKVPWDVVYFFWGDERVAAPDEPGSNFKMAVESLLGPLGIPSDNRRVNPMPSGGDPAQNAEQYEARLRHIFGIADGSTPRFDVVLLGMGDDGHTASLFPGTKALRETERLVVANRVAKLGTTRLTATLRLINNAHYVALLVTGEGKADHLAAALEPGKRFPVQQVDPIHGDLVWMVDAAAGEQLAVECEE